MGLHAAVNRAIEVRLPGPPILRGFVTESTTDASSLLKVRIPAFDDLHDLRPTGKKERHVWECMWTPRVHYADDPDTPINADIVWPSEGDRVTVVLDDQAVPTVIQYWPSGYERVKPPPD